MYQHERPDRERPTKQDQHFEESRVRELQARDVADEVDAEQWINDRLDRQRHELKGFERLVGEGVPADFGEGTELLKDRYVSPKVEVRQKEGERKWQRERKPATDETEVK